MAVNIPGLISIVVFYLVILAVGIYAAWRRNKMRKEQLSNEATSGAGEDIILAGRSIGWFVGTFTMTATWVGGGYINGTAESVYSSGLVWAQAPWCYALSMVVGGMFFARQMREQGYITMLDPLQEKYGEWMGALLYIPALLGETFWSAAILSALGATLSVILDINIDLAVILSALVAIGYTFFGGLYSVAYTDVVQLICIFIGLWLTIPFAFTHDKVVGISDTSDVWIGTLPRQSAASWTDYAVLLTFGGIPWQVYFQRVLSSKSATYAQALSFAAAFGAFFMAIPAVLIGAIAVSTDWKALNVTQQLTAAGAIKDTRLILPMVLQYLTPTWISFFGLGAVSAAVMSSADSSVLSASSMFSYNIYKILFRPKASDRELTWVIRVGIFVVGGVATVMALTIKSIYGLWYLCADLVFVILFPQLLCAVYFPFVNAYGSLAAYVVGMVLRVGGGEALVNLSPFIRYPYFNHAANDNSNFPFRIFSMLMSLTCLMLVSAFVNYLFETRNVPLKYDILKAFKRDKRSNSYVLRQRSLSKRSDLASSTYAAGDNEAKQVELQSYAYQNT